MNLLTMGIYYIFIVSKSGGLIFNYDHNLPQLENEKVSLAFKKGSVARDFLLYLARRFYDDKCKQISCTDSDTFCLHFTVKPAEKYTCVVFKNKQTKCIFPAAQVL